VPAAEASAPTDADIEALLAEGSKAIEAASTSEEVRALSGSIVGNRSPLGQVRAGLGRLEPDARRAIGRRVHEAMSALEERLGARRHELGVVEQAREIERDRLDLTELVRAAATSTPWRGHLNLVSQTQSVLEDVFVGMGFEVAEGPEAETDWYNFEALNIPPAHPARSMWDTLYLDVGEPETVMLRTHTSPVQIHLMEQAVASGMAPIHAVMPGRCYRRETPDARHLAVFHQIEGLVVDHGITFADLAGTIEVFTTAYFGADIHSRLRPSYFPFTEPSAEYEITCTICHGDGCRTCSQTGWIELGGCGVVDPAVFEAVGIDPEEWSGFAFGFGIDRCAQMRHQIDDMRVLADNDIRFLRQF
jgi:phenylalanyl-tRNA synthetase alpha chain